MDTNTPESVRETLVDLLERMAPEEGMTPSPWDGLTFYRASEPMPTRCVMYEPSLCVVAQGSKRAQLGDQVFTYDPLHYLVLSVPLPVEAQIMEASALEPYLGLSLNIRSSDLTELMIDMAGEGRPFDHATADAVPGIRVSAMSEAVSGALIRFLSALEDPMDRRILAPMVLRELLYHLLADEQGDLLRSIAVRDSGSHRVAQVIQYILSHYDESIDVPTLAKTAGMSTSSLHHAFKEVTSLSPIQFLKQIRLHRARLLMVHDGLNAGEAAFRVGYGSPSQFSREFKRFYGSTPTRDAERLREEQLAM